MRGQRGFSMVEMLFAAFLWLLMITAISQVLLQSNKQQVVTETLDMASLFGTTLGKFYTNPDNCTASLGGRALNMTDTPIVINSFPFKTVAGDTMTIASNTNVLGNLLRINTLTIKLKYPAGDSRIIPVWYNKKPLLRNSAIITANFDINVSGSAPKQGIMKTIEVPVLLSNTGVVDTCSVDAKASIEDACGVVFSDKSLTSTNCNPVKVEFKGAYHTREVLGTAYTPPCDVPVTVAPDPVQTTGQCPAGSYWVKDSTTPQCAPQSTCPNGKAMVSGTCYDACLPHVSGSVKCLNVDEGVMNGVCVKTSCPDQITYQCTCPSTGMIVNCGQKLDGIARAPCADPNTYAVDPNSGMSTCACPTTTPATTEYVTGSMDWVYTTPVLCGWSGYGKKVGPTYCPVSTGMRDTFYVCIKQ